MVISCDVCEKPGTYLRSGACNDAESFTEDVNARGIMACA